MHKNYPQKIKHFGHFDEHRLRRGWSRVEGALTQLALANNTSGNKKILYLAEQIEVLLNNFNISHTVKDVAILN